MKPIKVHLYLNKADGRTKAFYSSGIVICFIKSYDTTDKYTGNHVNKVLMKLNYLAKKGFYVDGNIIKYEWDGVHRIRVEDTGRIIGFFDGTDKFIAIDSFIKNKQKLTKPQIAKINKVAKIKKDKLWIIGIGEADYEC